MLSFPALIAALNALDPNAQWLLRSIGGDNDSPILSESGAKFFCHINTGKFVDRNYVGSSLGFGNTPEEALAQAIGKYEDYLNA